jgi:hypothetical protein
MGLHHILHVHGLNVDANNKIIASFFKNSKSASNEPNVDAYTQHTTSLIQILSN